MPKRFQVALSFPGEHRVRVEKIAEALAATLSRTSVLYDRWHGEEFNRVNLDVYLPKLYHDESEVVAIFLCKEYNAKEWCGLEWRACRDLLKHKEDERLMFFRLDDAEVPGLYSIDGYQNILHMSDAEVAADILKRIERLKPAVASAAARHPFTRKLPTVDPNVFGRDAQLDLLERAWADPRTNFVQIIAPGGTGKTALMTKWYKRHLDDATVFGWSFYSQGTREKSQTSVDPFFAEALAWFGLKVEPTASIYAKSDSLAERLRNERVLLILDGIEPLQDPSGDLRDLALKALLHDLAERNAGMVLVTTRDKLSDAPDDEPRVRSLDLDNLDPADSVHYLKHLGVAGPDDELREASEAYGNHALALTLLGTYLVTFCDADIRRRADIRELQVEDTKPGKHARKVMVSYARKYRGQPELGILKALGHFDRPAEPEALKLVLPKSDRKFRAALKRLRDARLILTADPTEELDCHPLVREHFAAYATPEGHARLYEHYKKQAPHRPDTLEKMTPLFYAVYHGCQAGKHQAALNDVFNDRIARGPDNNYLVRNLGVLGTNLLLLANFFDTPWTRPVGALSSVASAFVIGSAGYVLRALGRVADAVEPTLLAAETSVTLKNWSDASGYYGNVSELHLILGSIAEAGDAARKAVALAARGRNGFQGVISLSQLANALHQSGDLAEARRLFVQAEALQAQFESDHKTLYSVRGFQYCDLLIGRGNRTEVLRRAAEALRIAEGRSSLVDIGLVHISLGRTHAQGSAEAAKHLDQGVDFLRRSGHLAELVIGLLARSRRHDLDEVFRIATRSGMRLYLADYHLVSARNALADHDPSGARTHFERAETLIRETGYHRRDGELAELRAKLG